MTEDLRKAALAAKATADAFNVLPVTAFGGSEWHAHNEARENLRATLGNDYDAILALLDERDAAIARAEKAKGEIAHYHQDTGYVLGWNAGWDEAFGRLKFPTMLRKMWSGGEVQRWLDEQKAEQNGPPVGSLSERLAAAEASLAAVTAERDKLREAPRIEFHQQDWIPGFAAFNPDATTPPHQSRAFCVLNLGSILATVATGHVEKAEVPYFVAESMMHEVMHALEQWAGVEFNEERVDALLDKYRAILTKEPTNAE